MEVIKAIPNILNEIAFIFVNNLSDVVKNYIYGFTDITAEIINLKK